MAFYLDFSNKIPFTQYSREILLKLVRLVDVQFYQVFAGWELSCGNLLCPVIRELKLPLSNKSDNPAVEWGLEGEDENQ